MLHKRKSLFFLLISGIMGKYVHTYHLWKKNKHSAISIWRKRTQICISAAALQMTMSERYSKYVGMVYHIGSCSFVKHLRTWIRIYVNLDHFSQPISDASRLRSSRMIDVAILDTMWDHPCINARSMGQIIVLTQSTICWVVSGDLWYTYHVQTIKALISLIILFMGSSPACSWSRVWRI